VLYRNRRLIPCWTLPPSLASRWYLVAKVETDFRSALPEAATFTTIILATERSIIYLVRKRPNVLDGGTLLFGGSDTCRRGSVRISFTP
jgi:hypothetical protein